jgi:putative nucleotidyltransferase with HDIG domain
MRGSIREDDLIGRYGGDEFLCILPGLDEAGAADLMSRVARVVRRTPLTVADGDLTASSRLPARISWGVAAYPRDAQTARNLTSIADSRLMQSRVERNRSGQVNAERPSIAGLLEQDPEKVRIASSLLDLINAKDPYTSEHSQQIASFALLVANELGLPERERHALWLGSLLHDVGKLGTPADVLRKPGRLTPEEWTSMRQHPLMGESIVRGLLDMPEVTHIVGGHHERWDGSGYPRGLAGDEIPPLVRLVSVADTFSAMVHDRPYRRGLGWPEAAEELRRSGGTQLDPKAVETFIRALGIDSSGRNAA